MPELGKDKPPRTIHKLLREQLVELRAIRHHLETKSAPVDVAGIHHKLDKVLEGQRKLIMASAEEKQAIQDLLASEASMETRLEAIIALLKANPNDPAVLQQLVDLKAKLDAFQGEAPAPPQP
jgi:hypothetical protein